MMDIQEDITRALLSVNTEALSTAIQYGLMMNPGLIDMISPSILLITGKGIDEWKTGVNEQLNRWEYEFDWVVPSGYSVCIDHRKRLGVVNALERSIHSSVFHSFKWDLCQWYYDLELGKKGLLVTAMRDEHLEWEVEWLQRGIGKKVSIVEIPNDYSLYNLRKYYQLSVYEALDAIERIKVRSNIFYYLSHTYMIENFGKNKTLNISTISKY